jgi:hypothetical protein
MQEDLGSQPAAVDPLLGKIVLRPFKDEDENFVFRTWLEHYRQQSKITKNILKTTYFAGQHKVIERILKRSLTIIAAFEDSPSTILGYLVLEMTTPPTIHWMYVKGSWRRMGIAKSLLGKLNPNSCAFTHWTDEVDAFLRQRWPGAVYNPYKA